MAKTVRNSTHWFVDRGQRTLSKQLIFLYNDKYNDLCLIQGTVIIALHKRLSRALVDFSVALARTSQKSRIYIKKL